MKKLLTRIMRKNNKDKLSNTNLLKQQDLKTNKKMSKPFKTYSRFDENKFKYGKNLQKRCWKKTMPKAPNMISKLLRMLLNPPKLFKKL